MLDSISILVLSNGDVQSYACIRGGDLTSGATIQSAIHQSEGTHWKEYSFMEYSVVLTSGVTYELALRNSASSLSWWSKNNSNTYPYGNAYIENVSSTTCDMTFQINVKPAYCEYISQAYQAQSAGETWNQWEKIGLNGNDTGNIDIYTRTSGTSGGLTSQGWVMTSNNTSIASSTGPWVQFYTILNSTPARVDDVTIGFFASGNPDTLQIFPDIKKNRLYTTYTEIGQASNNKMLIYQGNNEAFTLISGFGVSYISKYKYDIYMGGTNGLIYLWDDNYTTFNGVDKNPYIKTKDFDFDNRLGNKILDTMYYNGNPSTLYNSATVDFYIDLSTGTRNTVSVPLNANNALYPNKPICYKIRKDIGRFKYVNFKLSNFDVFNGVDFYYEILERD